MEKWTDEDVQALLNIYAEENIQKEFESSARNAKVYQKISARLGEMGIQHSPQRCREKIKKMKQDYKKIKDHNRINGTNRRSGKWFERLDAILGERGRDSGCGESGESGDCVSVLLEPFSEEHRTFLHHGGEEEEEEGEEEGEEEEEEEEEEKVVSFTEDDQFSELSFDSPVAPSRPTHRPPAQPHPRAPRLGKRKRDGEVRGDVLEVLRQMEEEQMLDLRRDYEQRERHFQLLLQHIKEEFAVRQEEAAQARRQQREFQQGVLTLLTQLLYTLGGRTAPSSSSSSPPPD